MTDSYTYDAFGATRTGGASSNVWKFTGEQNDTTVNQSPYYLRARYYDPVIGRFLSRDPFAGFSTIPESLNRYPYVLNSPTGSVDPYGLFCVGDYCTSSVTHAVGNAASAVKQGAEAAGDYLNDPEHLKKVAEGTQLVSSVIATASCPFSASGVAAGVCLVSLTVYGGATGARIALADNTPEKIVLAGTGTLGFCTSFLPESGLAYKAIGWGSNAVSDTLEDLVSDPSTAYGGTGGGSSGGTGLSCPAGMVGEKYGK